MKTLAITLAATALMIPAAAQAGHYGGQACKSTSTVKMACESGVKVYRAQPIQYAHGHLERQVYAKQHVASAKKMQRQSLQLKRKLKAQNKKIAKLEKKLEKLEDANRPRRRGQFIQGVRFGADFLSPQRAPGFNNLVGPQG